MKYIFPNNVELNVSYSRDRHSLITVKDYKMYTHDQKSYIYYTSKVIKERKYEYVTKLPYEIIIGIILSFVYSNEYHNILPYLTTDFYIKILDNQYLPFYDLIVEYCLYYDADITNFVDYSLYIEN